MTTFLLCCLAFSVLVLTLTFLRFDIAKIILLVVLVRVFVESLYDVKLGQLGGYEVNPMSLWGGATIVLAIVYWLLVRRNPFIYHVSKWILMFVLSVLLGSVLTENVAPVIEHLVKYLSWLLVIPVVADISRRIPVETIFQAMYHILCLLILINLGLFLSGRYNTGYYDVGEFYGYFKGPHMFAFSLLFLIPFAVYRLYQQSTKLIPFLVLISCGMMVFLSFARVAWLACLVGSGAFLYLERRKLEKYALVAFSVLIALTLAYLLSEDLEPALQSRIRDFQLALASGDSGYLGSGRFTFWKIQVDDYIHSPFMDQLFGKGFHHITILTHREYGMDIGGHNDYLELLLGSGLFSMGAFVLLQMSLFREALFVYRTVDRLIGQTGIALMVSLVTIGAVNGILYAQSNIYNAVMLGSVLGIAHQIRAGTARETLNSQVSRVGANDNTFQSVKDVHSMV